MAGDNNGGGCFPNGRGYSTLAMDQPSSAADEADMEVSPDHKDAGALFVLESKGTGFAL